jgi:hypothetical protein
MIFIGKRCHWGLKEKSGCFKGDEIGINLERTFWGKNGEEMGRICGMIWGKIRKKFGGKFYGLFNYFFCSKK